MSIAGIRSNRGDGYQTLVAFDWALTVLADPDYQWLEIDSITYSVDDVVVGKTDGTLIACQCKKNQLDFKTWTITDLADELDKAFFLLTSNQNAEVRFYSRNNFGALAKLREHSSTQYDEASYRTSLGKDNQATDKALMAKIAISCPSLSVYEFLRRTKFVVSDELDRMVTLLRERLHNMASNPDAAFNVLWARLDQLGARMSDESLSAATQHRLTKDDLRAILQKVGAMLSPPMIADEVRTAFSGTSAIGRSWRRDIAGLRISSSTLNELLVAIDAKKRSILLTGMPGSGKTCAMLALQEELEKRAETNYDIVPLFIQSRDFADLATSQDRQALGLPEQWVEKAARMADVAHVIVAIDSLDVLSIARDHRVLKYFLAQLDRLLLIPNITVVTACRDFDRHYDRRISERQWDCELKCHPLDWDDEIAPLLDALGIATATIDAVTRKLISNPRELALFVELAMREGSFNIVTSQHLTQRYLDNTVRANGALGDTAMQAIESIADAMLKSRSMLVPHQRFTASQVILRELCSLNLLQETHDGKLVFGHQTLLDVLVISGALRRGITLNDFIHGLPPVPFVRPTIRSFITQLAFGERREFRKQIRAVLCGSFAFHVKRLVAEAFADYLPQDEDWSLLRDLRENHRDVFQVIYTTAGAIEWHYFWLKHLVPVLIAERNAEGLTGHAHQIGQWKNEDAPGVLSFWMEMISLDWLDGNGIADRIGIYLSDINPENLTLAPSLLERLLDMPQSDHSFLGRVIARCLTAGVVDDAMLWHYVADGVHEEDLLGYNFDRKLRCQPHEFGDQADNYLLQRMKQSTVLLDLALDSIEWWSIVRASRYGETRMAFRYGFLSETSYEDVHCQRDIRHINSLNILFEAVETAIIHHAVICSDWWLRNRERLCLNLEGALRYFAILACTASPEANTDLIGRMLCDKDMLSSELYYELGSMMSPAFQFMDPATQDAVMACIITLWEGEDKTASSHFWTLKKRAELISAIPCYQRSPEVQAVVDAYVKKAGFSIRQPDIRSYGGIVSAPFSFEVFLNASDSGVLNLLEHYNGHSDSHGADFLIGGEREVGWQLREASSRLPNRFLSMLPTYWESIPERFRDDIMDGVATYLDYRFGNLKANENWRPVQDPDASLLAGLILDELERHPKHWQQKRSAAKALKACANILLDMQNAARIIFLAIGFEKLHEDDSNMGDDVDLITLGINMVRGDVAEALMILVSNLQKHDVEFPELLIPTLRKFASYKHPAIRALILRRLPYLQSMNSELGWDLFHLTMRDAKGLWKIAEPCLYYAYHSHFELVKPLLFRLRSEGSDKDLKAWGRISALATMAQHIDFASFLESLNTLDCTEAWLGASAAWTHTGNIQQHRDQCLAGLSSGLNAGGSHAIAVARSMEHIFDANMMFVPTELLRRWFSTLEDHAENKHHRLYGLHEWLNETSQYDPDQALAATEIYLGYVRHTNTYLYDFENRLTQLLTHLFAEAEEREEFDHGTMLQRVVAVQDTLLSLRVSGVVDWLKAAERQ